MKKKIGIITVALLALCALLAACSTAPSVDILQTILRNKGIALEVEEYSLPEKGEDLFYGTSVDFTGRMTAKITAFEEDGTVAAEFFYFDNSEDAQRVYDRLVRAKEQAIERLSAELVEKPNDEETNASLAYWNARTLRINVDVVAAGREDLVKIVKE